MNKVFLKGRLTADPEFKKTPNDISVCKFTVAVNRRFDRDKTDFVMCEAWRNTAEFVNKYFNKGKEICLQGELHIDKLDKDGETKYFTKVSVDEVEFCGNKSDNASLDVSAEEKTSKQSPADFEELDVDEADLPF